MLKKIEIAIIGNPNSGKTTLFNALTGEKQQVGNWPGVTVEKKTGSFTYQQQTVNLVDLPGTYSLIVADDALSLDERIACDYLRTNSANVIVNVVDASHLERHLFLTTQLLEMGIPVVVALNMMDVARKSRLQIDSKQLARYLGCPVIPIEATKKSTLLALQASVVQQAASPTIPLLPFSYPVPFEKAMSTLMVEDVRTNLTPLVRRNFALRLLQQDRWAQQHATVAMLETAQQCHVRVLQDLNFEPDIVIAETRYSFIEGVLARVVTVASSQRRVVSDSIDRWVLNRFLGLPIFFLVMLSMFVFAINIAGIFQDYFDMASDFLFVQMPAHYLEAMDASRGWSIFIAAGLGKGINTVVTFIPVICGMFLSLSFLEQSGYMARAAFVVDRMMRAVGLPGKAFVPMIVGFGCNVPAVMATRTLENRRDRILTVMMSPFMSCSARLAIFAVFSAVFFPHQGALVVFLLYILGIFIAVLTGIVLRKTVLRGPSAPFILELPTYHWPSMRSLCLHTWHRLKSFITRAGLLIIPVCLVVEALNAWTLSATGPSLLAIFGQWLTPIFTPLGIQSYNWPATVGLLTGLLAKEVVVGTLNSLYGQMPHLGDMSAYFSGKVGAFAYLIFVLLYFPCVSTTAVIAREIGKNWAIFSVLWTTFIAYGVAVLFYQTATWSQHPIATGMWILGISSVYFFTFYMLRRCAPPPEEAAMSPTSTRKTAARCGGCLS